jgi:hypothetical protein
MTNLAWKHISIETSLHPLHPVVNSRKSGNLIFSFAIPSVLLVTQQGAENYNANTGDRRCVERRSFTPMSQLCYALCRSLLKTLARSHWLVEWCESFPLVGCVSSMAATSAVATSKLLLSMGV